MLDRAQYSKLKTFSPWDSELNHKSFYAECYSKQENSALIAVPTTTSRDLFVGSGTVADSRLSEQAAERRLVRTEIKAENFEYAYACKKS